MVACGYSQIPCLNVTCDRQTKRCKGCFGKSETERAFVMLSDVIVADTPDYDKNGARFDNFRSLRFTKLFFVDINAASSFVSVCNDGDLAIGNRTARRAMNAMVEIVNQNSGWTVAGWHRRGALTEENGETYLSSETKGHLVLLQPTQPDDIALPAFKSLLISFATDTPANQA